MCALFVLVSCVILCRRGLLRGLDFVQTRYGGALAVPLFTFLAQSRSGYIVGVDRGTGNFNRQSPEDRIRIVSGRYDFATKLMIQVGTDPLSHISLDPDLVALHLCLGKYPNREKLQLVLVSLYMVLWQNWLHIHLSHVFEYRGTMQVVKARLQSLLKIPISQLVEMSQ